MPHIPETQLRPHLLTVLRDDSYLLARWITGISEREDSDDDSNDNGDGNGTSLSPKSEMENQ